MRPRHLLACASIALAFAAPFITASCGGSGSGTGSGTGSESGSQTTGAGGYGGADGGGGSAGDFPDQSSCTDGEACGDGGICVGNACCEAAKACGSVCCSGADVCSFQACVTPGPTCHDSSDCGPGEYCEHSLGDNGDAGPTDAGCVGGALELTGKCLPKPPICAADAGPPDGGALTCLEQCEVKPSPMWVDPTLEYAWGGMIVAPYSTDVMMAPIVLELDDDDCDGKVTEKDIPEIVFTSFTGGNYLSVGVLHAISIVNGAVADKWSAPGIDPSAQLAGGNIDGAPGNEIVACAVPDGSLGLGPWTVKAFKGDGSPLWSTPVAYCYMPAIADLDGDGKVEVVVEGGILDGATGALKVALPGKEVFAISDIDGDGKLDLVSPGRAYKADGTLLVDTGIVASWSAVADFDLDGKPEIVSVNALPPAAGAPSHTLVLWRYDPAQPQKFSIVRSAVDINGTLPQHCPMASAGYKRGGGPPTVADFNGDGTPDVGLAGGIGYSVFDGKKLMDPAVGPQETILWQQVTTDCSSAQTGSSVFDFDGDGKAEVVYSDENHFRIYNGVDGTTRFTTCNTTGTLIEYPLVADVDNDGHADIVVVSNAYAHLNPEYACDDGVNPAQSGVRVFSAGNWVRTRRVWNEHAYHITNVAEDGTIPKAEIANWTVPGLDNFRQNKQPGGEFSAPDLVVALTPACVIQEGLVATVRNVGQAAAPAGVTVGFYEGAPPSGKLLGQAQTLKVLYSAESEIVVLPLASPDPALPNGMQTAYAKVDDTAAPHPSWTECRTDNNTSAPVFVKCDMPH
jgi:FG-GAP-like repeat